MKCFSTKGKNVDLIRYSGETFQIQGPNSQRLKLVPNLCAKCNGARSQSSDKSYTHFINSFKKLKNEFLDSNSIDFTKIYVGNWQIQKRNLYKYILKHACCRMSENQIVIPNAIVDFLDDRTDNCSFKIFFVSKLYDEFLMSHDIPSSYKSHLGILESPNKDPSYVVGWFTVFGLSLKYVVDLKHIKRFNNDLQASKSYLTKIDYSDFNFTREKKEGEEAKLFAELMTSLEYFPFKYENKLELYNLLINRKSS